LLPLIGLAGALTLGALRAVAPAPIDADDPAAAARRGRLPLALAVALGAGLLTVGLTMGQPLPTIGLSVVGGIVLLGALRRLTPAGTLVARPVMPAAVLLRGVLTCAFFAVDAFVALTLVEWRGVSATAAGIALTAMTITWTAGSWTQARGARRWPTFRFVQAGYAVLIVGLFGVLLTLVPDVTWLVAIPAFGVAGFGMGLSYAPLALIVLRESAVETQGANTSALSLTDSVGTALGTGLTGAIVAASVRANGEPALGLAVGFSLAIAIALVGLVLTRRLRPRTVPAGALAFSTASPPS
jgi:predicted MFS family arabinose efflux permease